MAISDNDVHALADLVNKLRTEADYLRDQLAAKNKTLAQAVELLSSIRGGVVSIPAPASTQVVHKAKPKRTYSRQSISMGKVQSGLVDFATKQDVFTTEQAIHYLLEKGVLDRASSTAVQMVRRLLSDTNLFHRHGDRDRTKWSAA